MTTPPSPHPNSPPPLLSTTSIQFLASAIPLITLSIALLTIARHIMIIIRINYFTQTKPHRLPPGPRGLPLLRNLPLILAPNLHLRLAHLSLTYGPIMRLRLGTKLWIVISSPKIAKQIFTENDTEFSDREQHIAATVISYNGSNLVRCPYGPTWRMLRRVFVREVINAKSLYADAGVELRRGEMRRAVRGIWGRQGRSIDVGELAFEVSVNMLMSMLCGDERSVRWRDEAGEGFRRVMMETVELLGRANVSDYLPFISRFDLQGIEREMRKRVEWLDRVYEDMIEERLRFRKCRDEEDGEEQGKDLLSRLLKIRDGEEPGYSKQLSNTQLKGLIMVMN